MLDDKVVKEALEAMDPDRKHKLVLVVVPREEDENGEMPSAIYGNCCVNCNYRILDQAAPVARRIAEARLIQEVLGEIGLGVFH